MRKGYITVKTKQAQDFAGICKAVDFLIWRLQVGSVSSGDQSFIPVSISLHDLYEEAYRMLLDTAKTFELHESQSRESYYRMVVKSSAYGRQRRMAMMTDIGSSLFRLCVSLDRMCIVVAMLVAEQQISRAQGREFFDKVESVIEKFALARSQLNRIAQHV